MTRTCRILAPAPWRSRGKDCGLMCKIPRSQHLMASSSSLLLAHGSTIQGRMHRYDEFCSWPDPNRPPLEWKKGNQKSKTAARRSICWSELPGPLGPAGGSEKWEKQLRNMEETPKASRTKASNVIMVLCHFHGGLSLAVRRRTSRFRGRPLWSRQNSFKPHCG